MCTLAVRRCFCKFKRNVKENFQHFTFNDFHTIISDVRDGVFSINSVPKLNRLFRLDYWRQTLEEKIWIECQRPTGLKPYTTLRLLASLFFFHYFLGFVVSLIVLVLQIGQSIILKTLIQGLKNDRFSTRAVCIRLFLLMVVELFICFADPHVRFLIRCLTIRVQKVLSMLIFERFLLCRIPDLNADYSIASEQKKPTNVLTILTADCEFLAASLGHFLELSIALFSLMLLLATGSFWGGSQTIIALYILVALVATSLLFEFLSGYFQRHLLSCRDSRLGCLQLITRDIKTIKLLQWESVVQQDVAQARKKEMHYIKIQTFFLYVSSVINQNLASLTCLGYFYVFYLKGEMNSPSTTAAIAISSQLALRNLIRPLGNLGRHVQGIIFGLSSFRRFDTFISSIHANYQLDGTTIACQPEHSIEPSSQLATNDNLYTPVLVVKQAIFSRTRPSLDEDITDIASLFVNYFELKKSNCAFITGPSGSGKTFFIMSLLNEFYLLKGNVHWYSSPYSEKGTSPSKDHPGSPYPVAYTPQMPWIPCGTVRDAILFGREFVYEAYERILDICELRQDMAYWVEKDNHLITERGDTISQGQRARIALARSLYMSNDKAVHFLDSTFELMDLNTGLRIFKYLFGEKGFLVESAVVLTISYERALFFFNNIHPKTTFLKFLFFQLSSGRLELIESTLPYFVECKDVATTILNHLPPTTISPRVSFPSSYESIPVNSPISREFQMNSSSCYDEPRHRWTSTHEALVYYTKVFGFFAIFCTGLCLVLYRILVALILLWTTFNSHLIGALEQRPKPLRLLLELSSKINYEPIMKHLSRNSLSILHATENSLNLTNGLSPRYIANGLRTFPFRSGNFLRKNIQKRTIVHSVRRLLRETGFSDTLLTNAPIIYLTLSIASVISLAIATVLQGYGLLQSATAIHSRLLVSFLNAELWVFSFIPSGALLNRFSTDTAIVDLKLTLNFFFCLSMTTHIVIFVILFFIFASFLIPIVLGVILTIVFLMKYRYAPANSELQQLKLGLLTPLVSLLDEAPNAVVTIRAFHASPRFLNENVELVTRIAMAEYGITGISSWLYLRQRCVSVPLLLVIAFAYYIQHSRSDEGYIGSWIFFNPLQRLFPTISVEQVFGFVAFQTFSLPFVLGFTLSQWAELQAKLCSVQRLMDIERLLKRQYFTPGQTSLSKIMDTPSSSIENGGLILRNVVVSYVKPILPNFISDTREDVSLKLLPPTLKGVTASALPSQCIALTGRTGSGKTTLLMTLLNQIPLISGKIILDGIRIENALDGVSPVVGVIPQCPVVIHGWPLRKLLDPSNAAPSTTILEALSQVKMLDRIASLPDGLQTCISIYPSTESSDVVQPSVLETKFGKQQEYLKSSSKHHFSSFEIYCFMIARLCITGIPYRLIVMDECNIDDTTERKATLKQRTTTQSNSFNILQLLRSTFPNAIVLVITHCFSIISSCDQLWLMSKGNLSVVQCECSNITEKGLQVLLESVE